MAETESLSPSLARHVDHVCDCFESSWRVWRSGTRPEIAEFLGAAREPERSVLLRELIQLEVFYRRGRGESWHVDDFRKAFPDVDAEWLFSLADRPAASTPDAAELDSLVSRHSDATVGSSEPGIGLSVAGYELLETIRSGMAVVYKAQQLRPRRLVALKALLPRAEMTDVDLQRFLYTEADHVARLDHPNVIPIYEVGMLAGRPYFSMKWIDGGSLAQSVASGQWPLGKRDSIRRAAQMMATVARAVHYAHERGILHRDLKPSNILLDASGRPYVSDFGLARTLSEIELPGEIAGTPSYMSPEQAAGGKALTTKADIYGLGAVLYELLTGRPPFRGDSTADTLRQVTERAPESPSAMNPAIEADVEIICLKCLSKDPELRYDSAEAFAKDLERWLAGEPILARPSRFGELVIKWAKRSPAAAALTAMSIAAAILVFGLIVREWREAVAEQQRAEVRRMDLRVEEAERLTFMIKESQKLYSEKVVDWLKRSGVKASHDYVPQEGTIPLPPTLTMMLAKSISEKSSGTVRLYSDDPFKNSQTVRPPLDRFEDEALVNLRQDSSKPFYRVEEWQRRPSLRYATADVMKQQCVDCHNNHPDSPKKDWKVGDVRGALEVILPLD